ncbi:unnamed protein product [Chironomus riparius]|uniref:Peptidase S1 domain-containing protein n=1 Tax=Chironomus riparius TaxID=315576 RepID=A0A9N9WNG9_9DIPT|nr:unnamed protein product [Chironomus riparius]
MRSLTFNKIIFLILLNFKDSISSNFYVGKSCELKSGARGTCQQWNDCSIVKELWEKKAISRAHVTDCDIVKRLICCPISLDDETSTHRTRTPQFDEVKTTVRVTRPTRQRRPKTTTTTEPPTTQASTRRHFNRDQERISQIKCKEYAKKVWHTTLIAPLPGQTPLERRNSKCTHKSTPLIVGGTAAVMDEFPHQALLGYSPRNTVEWLCGGSLVSATFVITAAHCLFERQKGHVQKVKVGMRYKDQEHDNRKVFVYNIKKTFKHQNYNEQTFNEDIALLKLDGTVPIDEHILPICLPTMQYEAEKVLATGFGVTQTYGQQSEVLLKVTLESFLPTDCKAAFPEDGIVQFDEQTMLCYGHHRERKDTCRVRIKSTDIDSFI